MLWRSFVGVALVQALLWASGCVIVVSDGEWEGWGSRVMSEKVAETVPLDAALVRKLDVETHNGEIKFDGSTDGPPQVVITKRAGGKSRDDAAEALQALQTFVEPESDGTYRVGYRWSTLKKSRWSAHVSLEIHAPGSVALVAETHNGSIDVRGSAADVDVLTHNGPVHIESSGATLAAETHNGPIRAITAAANLQLSTHNGGIDATLTRAGALSGEIETHNGGVDVQVREGLSTKLECSTHNGGVSAEAIVTPVTVRRRELSATIGGGEGKLEVSTHNGSVRVRGSG